MSCLDTILINVNDVLIVLQISVNSCVRSSTTIPIKRVPKSLFYTPSVGLPYSFLLYRIKYHKSSITPLIRVAKELTGKRNVLVAICKVPSYNSWVLATADDPARIELQLKHSRVGAVGIEGRRKWMWSVVVMVVVMMRLSVCRSCLCRCCCMSGWLVVADCGMRRRGRPGSVVTSS